MINIDFSHYEIKKKENLNKFNNLILTPTASENNQITNLPDKILVRKPDGTYKEVHLNTKQREAASLIASLKSCVLIGAAGTGKTTCLQAAITALIQANKLPQYGTEHKFLNSYNFGYAQIAYMRRVVAVNKRNSSPDLIDNCLTIHKLLEYEPVFYEIIDDNGRIRKTMRFEPMRNTTRKLSQNLNLVICDESGTTSLELHDKLLDALPAHTVIIYVGDIQQLPPVYGDAILGYKMLELPVIELTEVYRQALDSPIIRLAHRILSGKVIQKAELLSDTWQSPGQLQILTFPLGSSENNAIAQCKAMFIKALSQGKYNPETDIILLPKNKGFGQETLNKHIAYHIASQNNEPTYEIIAGFDTIYLSVGNRISYDQQDGYIIEIKPNKAYIGKPYKHESISLDYFGHDSSGLNELSNTGFDDMFGQIDDEIESILTLDMDKENELTRQASHLVKIRLSESGLEFTLNNLGQLKALSLNYAITVHKSQGSEWDKVFLLLHNSSKNMLNRELLYTAVTRASKQLIILCEETSFIRGINIQRIKGQTIKEKAEFFKGKQENKQLRSLI